MTRILIDPNTYEARQAPTEEVGAYYASIITGAVTVQYAGRQITVWAIKFQDDDIHALGFVGRYRTSVRPWRASLSIDTAGRQHAWFGRDDRVGRFHKQSGITYEPETFFKQGETS